MKSPVQIVALCWLILIGGFVYGAMAVRHDLWPWPAIEELEAFLEGHEEEQTSLTEKVRNDMGLLPARHLVPPPNLDHAGPGYGFIDVAVDPRRRPPMAFLADDAPRGFRVVYGVFDLETSLHGVILLGPEGDVENVWPISQEGIDWPHRPDANVFPHGFEILKDGSILVAYDGGTSLTRYDWCGNEIWRVMGGFHHSIDLVDQSAFWVWGQEGTPSMYGEDMIEMRVEDGTVLRTISIEEMIAANPDIDIFGIRQLDSEQGSRWLQQGGGPFHQNDIDPLPSRLAAAYPEFEAGDLLISMRSINLIYVLDPDTLAVKWWRQGLTRRQHDPDWNDRGTITIFDNNMHRGNSHVVELDPQSLKSERILDGKDHHFYTWHRGKHQQLDSGHLLVTSSAQGRVFEVAPDGSVTFDFLNLYSPEQGALVVSEARFLPVDYFEDLASCER